MDARHVHVHEHVHSFKNEARLFYICVNAHFDFRVLLTFRTFWSITIDTADPTNIPVAVGIFSLA